MISRETLKSEIDNIPSEYYNVLYRLLKSLGGVKKLHRRARNKKSTVSQVNTDWELFIQKTYGSLANNPIMRADQGSFESRSELL